MFSLLKLVYKNMIWNRPKVALLGLITVALLTTGSLYLNLSHFGNAIAVPAVLTALGCWFFVLPCVFTLIDLKHKPKRMEQLLSMFKLNR